MLQTIWRSCVGVGASRGIPDKDALAENWQVQIINVNALSSGI